LDSGVPPSFALVAWKWIGRVARVLEFLSSSVVEKFAQLSGILLLWAAAIYVQ
jgi:hypothetical protein